jgi:type I restriction-modification system DNA methylase subunit
VAEEEKPIDVQKVLNELDGLKRERTDIEAKMNKFLKELGYRI